jgi:tetratricopeptide (TPR) repeat protein
MLFDLRSRGRRTTVRGIYLTLALVMGGGLILFGVGTGVSGGGLLNAFGGGGGSGTQNQVVNSAVRAAQKAVKANPNSPAAWAQMVQARWTAAGQGSNYDSATQSFTASGQKQLNQATAAWQHYLTLTKGSDPKGIATLAARAYSSLKDWAGEAGAWEVVAASSPSAPKGYECLALSAYAAGQIDKGDLALNKALSLLPKSQRKTLSTQIQAAKKQPTLAQQC